jgi:hypothetical protein
MSHAHPFLTQEKFRSQRACIPPFKPVTYGDDLLVRERAALHPAAPLEALKYLSYDPFKSVRAKVAENPFTPPQLLSQLAHDRHRVVRTAVLRNRYTPVSARLIAVLRNIVVPE